MKAMILAAGKGKRLRPITDNIPKPMVSIGGKPLLEYTVQLLIGYDIRDIVINLHHCPESIVSHFGDGSKWGVSITYSWEKRLLGTAGAVKKMKPFFDDTFIVFYGDNLSNCNLFRLCDFHHSKKGIATIALHEREDATSSGIAMLGKDHQIEKFMEKPRREQVFSNFINAGILVLEPRILEYIPEDKANDFGKDIFPQLINAGELLYGYVMPEDLLWVDTPEDYEYVQNHFFEFRNRFESN